MQSRAGSESIVWEYCRLYTNVEGYSSVVYCGAAGSRAATIKRNKEMGDRDEIDAHMRAIAELGQEGWEMVSCYHDGNYPQFVFKRLGAAPVPAPQPTQPSAARPELQAIARRLSELP